MGRDPATGAASAVRAPGRPPGRGGYAARRRLRRPRPAGRPGIDRPPADGRVARPGGPPPRVWPATGRRGGLAARPRTRRLASAGARSPMTRSSWPAGDRWRRPSPPAAQPPPAGRAGAPRGARPAGAARHGPAHPGRGGRGRHADLADRLRRPPGRRAGRRAAPLGDPRRRHGPRPRARRAALRAGARLARGSPERGHACCAAPRPAASTACCSRSAARRPSGPRPSRHRRAPWSIC